jgi:hypothetical protein
VTESESNDTDDTAIKPLIESRASSKRKVIDHDFEKTMADVMKKQLLLLGVISENACDTIVNMLMDKDDHPSRLIAFVCDVICKIANSSDVLHSLVCAQLRSRGTIPHLLRSCINSRHVGLCKLITTPY